ncbi:MAG TPA: ABC transporter permease subunit, partial [Alphaproteobacteria bacterium]|nr:ABC transporter permease subunit [Alphaproteobacteria bacterium]
MAHLIQNRQRHILPGFGLNMGVMLFFVGLLIVLPLAALFMHTTNISWSKFVDIAQDERVQSALKLSFSSAIIAALINLFAGIMVAWVLVRYDFIGRRLFDSLIDFPFALPTAVAGMTLASLYDHNGWLGGLLKSVGIQVVQTQVGIVLALVFIGFPFVVRSVQPVLADMNQEIEQAAKSLGAN